MYILLYPVPILLSGLILLNTHTLFVYQEERRGPAPQDPGQEGQGEAGCGEQPAHRD